MMKNTVFAIVIMAAFLTPLWGQTESDFIYTLNRTNDGVVITGYRGTATRVTIPATIEGLPVREIGSNILSARNARVSTRETTMYNFVGTLDTAVYTIHLNYRLDDRRLFSGTLAFKITSIVIPEGVTRIGAFAFAELGPEPGIIIGFENTWREVVVTHSLTSVTIPSTVTEIGEGAFENCQRLGAVTLPPSLTTLGNRAFANTRSLRTIVIPEGYTHLPDGLFAGSGLSSVTLPQSLITIGQNTFSGCSSLVSITLPDSVMGIGNSAFANSGLTSFNWPAEIYFITNGVFQGSSLSTINIPEGVTDIGQSAFASCRGLTSVTFPSTIRVIDGNAFSGCSALTTVTVPDSVTSIRFNGSGQFGSTGLGLAMRAALNGIGYTGSF